MTGAVPHSESTTAGKMPHRRRSARSPAQALSRGNIRRRLLALAVLLAGAWLGSLAWPRLQASLIFLPVDTAIGRYFDSREIPSAQLGALVAQAEAAIAQQPHYRYYNALSLLHYLRALDPATRSSERGPALQQVIASAEAALARAPAKPATWLRLAQSRAALGQGEYAVLPALEMSILTGRVEPTLLLQRLQLGLRYLPSLEPESVALLRDQLLLAWRINPRGFRNAVRDGRLPLERVRELAGPTEEELLSELEAGLQARSGRR